jgi:hypothetical protein
MRFSTGYDCSWTLSPPAIFSDIFRIMQDGHKFLQFRNQNPPTILLSQSNVKQEITDIVLNSSISVIHTDRMKLEQDLICVGDFDGYIMQRLQDCGVPTWTFTRPLSIVNHTGIT